MFIKYGLSTSIFILILIISSGCEKKELLSIEEYTYIPLPQLVAESQEYIGQKISTEGYVLGLEHQPDAKDGEIWIFVLGDKPHSGDSAPNQLIFPTITNKIRVGEDGFNSEIIKRCHEICSVSQIKDDLIKVYGIFTPSQTFHHYSSGVDLFLNAVEVDGVLVDTDFNDHGKIKEKTPSVLRKLYKGAESLGKLVKKAIL